MLDTITNFFFNFDQWLDASLLLHPAVTYSLLFTILFSESAFFPVSAFLPGDSLLFTVGILAASGSVHLLLAVGVLLLGAYMGSYVAYRTGLSFGPTIFQRFSWLNQDHYNRSNKFYERYGDRALIIGRFIPIVRAVVPLVAGMAGMPQRQFNRFSMIGIAVWVFSLVALGYFLNEFSFIHQHFTKILLLVSFFSTIILLLGLFRVMRKGTKA